MVRKVSIFGPVLIIRNQEFFLIYSDVYMKRYKQYPALCISHVLYCNLQINEIF